MLRIFLSFFLVASASLSPSLAQAQSVYERYPFITFAGGPPSKGSVDGIGSAARFNQPGGVAVDSAGNVYVADTGNSTIRKMTPGGLVSTLAGSAGKPGSTDGTGIAAQFSGPTGVAVDNGGNVYVADNGNSTIRKISPAGEVSTLAGLANSRGSSDGSGSVARFNFPYAVAVDTAGNIYVADSGNNIIRKVTRTGLVSTVAGLAGSSGSADGIGSNARFFSPHGIAADSSANLYVSDSNNDTIRKITGGGSVTTVAGVAGQSGSSDGVGSMARFYFPWGISVDSAGNIYVADFVNDTIRKITPSGSVSTLAGLARNADSVDGVGAAARFNFPQGVAVDGSEGAFFLRAPWIRQRNPIGAGDCFAAALVVAVEARRAPAEAIRNAVAVAAASVETDVPGLFDPDRARRLEMEALV